MGDRTYARFSIPLSVLSDPSRAEAVREAFRLTTAEFQQAVLADPAPDEAAGYEGTTTRLVDGRPCLVFENPDCAYGGVHIEQALTQARVPFLQVNGAGDEYGPTATAWLPSDTETIRLDHDLHPVVGVGIVDGRITLDQGEIHDVEHYHQVRRAVLLWPAR